MKKAILFVAAFILVFSISILAEDPAAGGPIEGDFGMPSDPTVADNPGAAADPLAADMAAAGDPLASDMATAGDPLADQGAAMMPDETGTGNAAAGDPLAGDVGAAGDPLAGDANQGADPFATDNGAGQTVDAGALFGDEGAAMPDSGAGGAVEQVPALPDEPKATAVPKKTNVKKGIPTYKAVPLTNDIRPMTKDGKLGQVESLARYMDWGYASSSNMKKNHIPQNLMDSDLTTAWVAGQGKAEYGLGESVTFLMDPVYFAPIHEGEVEAVNWTGFKVINGYNKTKEDWTNNARVKTMKIYHNKKPVCRIELYDTTNWQTITFKKPIRVKPGDRIKCVIEDAFEAYKYPNTALSEFLLTGEPQYVLIGDETLDGHSRLGMRN